MMVKVFTHFLLETICLTHYQKKIKMNFKTIYPDLRIFSGDNKAAMILKFIRGLVYLK